MTTATPQRQAAGSGSSSCGTARTVRAGQAVTVLPRPVLTLHSRTHEPRRRTTAVLGAVLLVFGAGAASATWQRTDPCRDLANTADFPLAATTGDYVGLQPAEAVALAKERGVSIRVAWKDRQVRIGTADLRDDRINVGISGDEVVGAGAY